MPQHICFIIPPQLSRAIVDSADVDDEVKAFHRDTIARTNGLRAVRVERQRAPVIGEQPAWAYNIVPPQIQSAIVAFGEPDDQKTANRTLEHDTEVRAARKGINRIVYDFEHSDNTLELPGDTIVRKEGQGPVSIAKDNSNDANECFEGFGDTYKLFEEVFKRKSIDNKGSRLTGTIHFGTKYQNAFWDGREMVFGDGDGKIFQDFTSRNDIIGHELTHAVNQFTANLDYENQSGALNESIADCFGIMVKQYKLKQTAEQSDWIIAQGIFAPGIKGVGLRSMKAPGTAYNDPLVGKDPQPAHMAKYRNYPNTEEGDYGGVHTNSGIPNHAFYLACIKIGGYPWETAGPIWYKTLTGGKLKHDATFEQFAKLTIANAGNKTDHVAAAWKEVGVILATQRQEL